MFDPTEFLKQAKQWVENRDQASLRSATSRAYYSLYNATLEYLKTNRKKELIQGIRNENGNSSRPKDLNNKLLKALDRNYLGSIVPMHKVVSDVCHNLRARQFGSQLRTNHEFRKTADYDMDETMDYDEVKMMIKDIDFLLSQLKQKKL